MITLFHSRQSDSLPKPRIKLYLNKYWYTHICIYIYMYTYIYNGRNTVQRAYAAPLDVVVEVQMQ